MDVEDGFPTLGASPLLSSLTEAIRYHNNMGVYVLEIYPSPRFHLKAAIQYHFIAKLIEQGYDVLVVWRDSNLNPFFLTRKKPTHSTERMLNIWKNSLLKFLECLELDDEKIEFVSASQVWMDLISPNDEKGLKQNVLRLTLMMHLSAVSKEAKDSLEEHHYHCDPEVRTMSPDKAYLEAAEALAVQYIAYSSLIDDIFPKRPKLVLIRDQSHKHFSGFIQDLISLEQKEFTEKIEEGESEPQEKRRYAPLDIFYTNEHYHYYQEEPTVQDVIGGVGWLEFTLQETQTARENENFPPPDPKQRTGILNHLDNDEVISDVLSKVMNPTKFDIQFFAAKKGKLETLIEPKDYKWIYACFNIYQKIYQKSLLTHPDINPIFLSDSASLKFLPATIWKRWCEVSTIYWEAVAANDYKSIENEKWVAKSHLKVKKIGEKEVLRKNHKELYKLIEADMSSGEPRSKPPFVRVLEDNSTVMNDDDVIVEIAFFSKDATRRKKHKLPPGSQHFRLLGNAIQFSSSPIGFRLEEP